MTRDDVLKIMPNATDEQITQILNAHHSELTAEKDKTKNLKSTEAELEKVKSELDKLRQTPGGEANAELQTKIDELTKANAEAKQTIKDMQLKTSLLGQGFVETDVDEYIKTLNEGGDIASVLGKMKENVISAHDKARMENTPDPKGSGNTPPDTKDTAEKLVSNIFGESSNKTNDILSHYKK